MSLIKKYVGDRAFYKRLLIVMTPILIQNVITNFVSLLDNIMVGRVGTEQMTGVGIVNQIIFVFNLCIFGALAGPGIFTAQYAGSGDNEGIRHTFRLKAILSCVITAIFIALFLIFGDKLIMLFLHEGKDDIDIGLTLEYGKKYLAVMLIQLLPFAIANVYGGTLRETGETVLPMVSGVVAVAVNVFLNYVLIFGKLGAPALGVEGAAIATVIARFVECGIMIVWTHARRKKHRYIIGVYKSLRVPAELIRRVAVLGSPLLLNELLWSSGMAVLNQCFSLRGVEVVSALNISTTVSNLFFCAFFAMGSCVSIMVGQLLGAGETERAVDEDRKLIAFSVALCAAVGVVMAIVAPFIPQIYKTTDTVKSIAASFIIVSACMMPFNAFTNTCYFTLRSGGKTWITFLFDSAFVWCVCIPVATCIARLTSVPTLPMFVIVQSLELIKCCLGFVLVKRRKWVNNLVSTEKVK